MHHRNERIDTVKLHVTIFDFSPRIEEIIRGEERAVFVIRSVADYDESVVLKDFGDVSTIANGELCIGIHNGSVFFDSTLKFKHNNRDTVYKNDTVWNTSLIVDAVNLKLIYDLENVVVGIFKVDKLNENILLGSVLSVENKAIGNELIDRLVSLVNRTRDIAEG